MKIIEYILFLYDHSVNNQILRKYKIYRLYSLVANIFLPIYFRISFSKHKLVFEQNENDRKLNIVSLTTFPKRINKIWIVIELMIRQTYKPDKIVLWLSTDEFRSTHVLPRMLKKQIKKGLEINFVDKNYRSHNKYFFAFKQYPEHNIITIDDDVLYSTKTLEKLLTYHTKFPTSICCNQALKIGVKNNIILPYLLWEYSFSEFSNTNFLMGVGGVLYPPNSLSDRLFDTDVFMSICKSADDIWLNSMAILNGTVVVRTNNEFTYLPVIYSGNVKLATTNVGFGQNDVQLNNVRLFLKKEYKFDPYLNLIR